MEKNIYEDLRRELKNIPKIDIHCHLKLETPNAQNIGDILFYHWVRREFFSAGGDDEFLVSERPLEERIKYFLKYFPEIENTSTIWCVKKIFKDLYGIEKIDKNSWIKVQEKIEKEKNNEDWVKDILLKKLKIEKSYTCYDWRGNLEEEKRKEREYLKLHLEGICFGPLLGEGLLDFVSKGRENLSESEEYFLKHIKKIVENGFISLGIAFDYLFQPVFYPREKLKDIYHRYINGEKISEEEKNALSTNFLYLLLKEIKGKLTIQVILGAIWKFGGSNLDFRYGESYVMVSHKLIPGLLQIFKNFPDINFNIYSCTKSLSHEITILARMLPNVSLLGFWWHTLFPGYIRELISERLEVLPVNKWILIATDAYNCEWSYGKFSLVENTLVEVLEEKMEKGYFGFEESLSIARKIMYENPKRIYNIK